MIFRIIITVIEALIASGFVVVGLGLESKIKRTIYLAIIWSAEIMFFNFIYINNFLLFICVLLSVVAFLYIVTGKIKFIYFLMVIYAYVLIIVSDVAAIYIASNILNLQFTDIGNDLVLFVTAASLSKIINFILCGLSINLLKRRNNSLSISNWWLFLVFFSIVILIIAVILESIIFSQVTSYVLEFVVIGLVFLCIVAIFIYLKIDKDNKIKMEMQKILIMNEYMNKNYNKMNYLHNRIIEERHKMIYLMMKIKNHLNNKDYIVMESILNDEIEKLNKFQIVSSTSNPYFDFELNEAINSLKEKGFDVTIVCELKKEDVLLQEEVVNDIINSIKYMANYSNTKKKITILISNTEMYIIVKINTYSNSFNDIQQIQLNSHQVRKSKLNNIDNVLNLKLLISKEIKL